MITRFQIIDIGTTSSSGTLIDPFGVLERRR